MYYKVTARLKEGRGPELLRRIQDGSIASQKPDGSEIVAAMKRAVVSENGQTEWSEVCYCSPPLAHERQTVLDRYFTDIESEVVDGYQQHAGSPFTDLLAKLTKQTSNIKD
jgi:hypothetical protein